MSQNDSYNQDSYEREGVVPASEPGAARRAGGSAGVPAQGGGRVAAGGYFAANGQQHLAGAADKQMAAWEGGAESVQGRSSYGQGVAQGAPNQTPGGQDVPAQGAYGQVGATQYMPSDVARRAQREANGSAERALKSGRSAVRHNGAGGYAARGGAYESDQLAGNTSVFGDRTAGGFWGRRSRAGRGGKGVASKPSFFGAPARHGFLSFILWLIFLAAVALMAVRLIPLEYSTGRMVPELASFVPLAVVPLALCLVLAILWHRRVLMVLSLIAVVVYGAWHAGYFVPTARVSTEAEAAVGASTGSATTDDAYARIMTLNTANGYASAAEIVNVVREQHVEVLCLQELPSSMLDDLENAGINELLPYSVVSDAATSVSNGGRNGIWCAAPIGNVSRNLLPIQTSSMPAVDITVGSRTVRVVSVHPNSPVRGAQDLWNEGLSVIGSLSDYSHAYLIMGDFNSTWDHARFRELLGDSFADASQQAGEGFHMTYPANSAVPSLIEIDHIVYSKNSGITVSSLQTVTIAGSDHKALLATLEAN